MRFLTAGESHGKGLVGIIDGIPYGMRIDKNKIVTELFRRRKFYGRSQRMRIEADELEFMSGIYQGITTGSPISFIIKNNDYRKDMFEGSASGEYEITSPRPGHADFAGMAKYNLTDARIIAERASARETATRTVVGAIFRQILESLGIHVFSHVTAIGSVTSNTSYYSEHNSFSDEAGSYKAYSIFDTLGVNEIADADRVRCLDASASRRMIELIDTASNNGDTLGGSAEIILRGMPAGYGSYVHYDKRLDAKIAAALMSIPSVKGVHIGKKDVAKNNGSANSDTILLKDNTIFRPKNINGGIEGGMTNGADIVISLDVKPIPTMKKGAETVDMRNYTKTVAHYERSDICVLPAISVIAENILACTIADTLLSELMANTMQELRHSFLYKRSQQSIKCKDENDSIK